MRYGLYRSLFVLLLFAEILLVTSQRSRYMGQRENGIVLTSLAVLMGLMALLAAFEKRRPEPVSPVTSRDIWPMRVVLLIGIAMAIFHFKREISVIPIAPQLSDIIPTIQVMNHRLLAGQYPYEIIHEFGYALSPTYLPLMWLPFFPAALFHFDERWVAFTIWLIATLMVIWRAHQSNLSGMARWLVTALPFMHFILIEEGTSATFGNTVELMIAGFYMMWALQMDRIRELLRGNPWKSGAILGFFLILCLLSRYAFLLWLPLCCFVVWIENRKLVLTTSVSTLVGVLVLFVIPFMLKDPMVYIKGLQHYSSAALAAWQQEGQQGPLYDGIGVGGIFRDGIQGDMSVRLATLQRSQLIITLLAVGLSGLYWWRNRQKLQSLPLFLLGSLKFYFAFFYGFIQMPYIYLMLTPCFFSVAMLPTWYKPVKQD
ncbi:MAG: hypothetical protein J0M29_00190 [Chitinophagales bacterium]|nr:hypothetical protein [Chitinophagales bacterium]